MAERLIVSPEVFESHTTAMMYQAFRQKELRQSGVRSKMGEIVYDAESRKKGWRYTIIMQEIEDKENG